MKFVSPEKAHNSPNSSTAPSLTLCVSVLVGMAIYWKIYSKFSKKAGEREREKHTSPALLNKN